jgi:hypothetical protein
MPNIPDTTATLAKRFADEMVNLHLHDKEALELAIQAASGCTNAKETALAVREVYFLITQGHTIIEL